MTIAISAATKPATTIYLRALNNAGPRTTRDFEESALQEPGSDRLRERRSGGEPAAGLAARLRHVTAGAHQRTERAYGFAQIQDGTLSLEIYRSLLTRLLALYTPAERAISGFIARSAPDYRYHSKVHHIADDLAMLGLAADVTREYKLTADSPEHCVALIYVLEGATLGGKIITSRVRAQLGEPGRHATRFFDPYGADCGARWQATRTFLDNAVHMHVVDEDAVLSRACEAFTWFGDCVNEEP